MEGGKLSRPKHYRKGAQPVPKAVNHSGCCDRHKCPWLLTPQSVMPSLNHCNLQRHMGVNNLPKIVTRQRHSREVNSQPSSCKSNAITTRLPSHPFVTRNKCTLNNVHQMTSYFKDLTDFLCREG